MAGFIKIHRSCRNNVLWKDKPFTRWQAFEDLLLSAAYEPHDTIIKGSIIHLERGQLIRAIHSLSDDWGWSVKKTNSFMKLLENQKMAISKGTPQGTLITIENYSVYQDDGKVKDTSKGRAKGRASGEQKIYEEEREEIKEGKEDKKRKKISELLEPIDTSLHQLFYDYLEVRKQNKMKDTDQAIKLLVTALLKESNGDNEYAKAIIEQSIVKNYKSFFKVNDYAEKKKREKEDSWKNW